MTEQSETVTEVIDGRVGVYGDPVETFPRIAQIWSAIVGCEITAEQVPLMLIGLKLLRTAEAPDYSDNSDDIEGYLDIFRKIVGDNMIQARSVTEYLEKKEAAALPEHDFREDDAGFYCSGCSWKSRSPFPQARLQFSYAHETEG